MMASLLIQVFCGIFLLTQLCATGKNDEHELYEWLTGNILTSRTPHVRPKQLHNEDLDVQLSFELLKIISVEEKTQVMTSVGFIVAEWVDDHIHWTPDVFDGIETLVLPPSKIWLPDFGLANSAGEFYKSTFFKDFRVRLHHDGRIVWSFGGELQTLCKLDMTFYPFDLQACDICLENMAYDLAEVNLSCKSPTISMSEYEHNGVWDMVSGIAKRKLLYFNTTDEEMPQVCFTLNLQRKALFYILNLICPCALIIIVALAVYWLPAESGEKVSLGVTILLAFSVFQLVIADQTPVNSDFTPILARMVLSIMSLSSLSVLTSIWVLYLHHMDSSRRVPACIKALCFRILAPMLCMRSIVPRASRHDHLTPKPSTVVDNAEVHGRGAGPEGANGSLNRTPAPATACVPVTPPVVPPRVAPASPVPTGIVPAATDLTSTATANIPADMDHASTATANTPADTDHAPTAVISAPVPAPAAPVASATHASEAPATSAGLSRVLDNLVYMTDRSKARDRRDAVMAEWRAVAKVMDRVLFWVSTVIVLVIFVVLVTQQDTEH